MFALVALACLYLGTGNIRKAFAAPFQAWQFINWALFITGIILLLLALACIWQANKDFQAARKTAENNLEKQAKQKKSQYYYDEQASEPAASRDKPSSDGSDHYAQ